MKRSKKVNHKHIKLPQRPLLSKKTWKHGNHNCPANHHTLGLIQLNTKDPKMKEAMVIIVFFNLALAVSLGSPKRRKGNDLSTQMSNGNGFCLFSNEACEMQPDNLITQFEETSNPVGCAERCSQSDSCQHWTWWDGKSSYSNTSNLCQLFTSCHLTPNCTNCYTGPRSCGLWDNSLAAVTGGKDKGVIIGNVKLVGESICQMELELPHPRWGHVSATIGGEFVVCGGSSDPDMSVIPAATCDSYNVISRKWRTVSEMTVARHSAAGVESFGEFYIFGGITENGPTNAVEMYNPKTGEWRKGKDLPEALVGHCAVAVDDTILLIGGRNADDVDLGSVYIFNVTTRMWTVLPNQMSTPRRLHGCSHYHRPRPNHTAPVREIVVTGGYQGKNTVNTVEAFCIFTKTWRTLNPLPLAMAGHAQINLGVPRTYGGVVGGHETSKVLQMGSRESWGWANTTIENARMYASVSPFPGDLIDC